jgi:hypothetical protein
MRDGGSAQRARSIVSIMPMGKVCVMGTDGGITVRSGQVRAGQAVGLVPRQIRLVPSQIRLVGPGGEQASGTGALGTAVRASHRNEQRERAVNSEQLQRAD